MAVSHQTLRLSRGTHTSPSEGASALELSALLAGEPFSDTPACVDPVIAAFLRVLNDELDDGARQRLRAFAADVVGTCGTVADEERRARLCTETAGVGGPRGWGGPERRARARTRAATRAALALVHSSGRTSIDDCLEVLDRMIFIGAHRPRVQVPFPRPEEGVVEHELGDS